MAIDDDEPLDAACTQCKRAQRAQPPTPHTPTRAHKKSGAQHNNSTTHPDAAEGVVGLVEREVGHDVYELLLGKALELFF